MTIIAFSGYNRGRMVAKSKSLKFIDKLYLGLILVIFGGIVLHAPATVWLGNMMPDYAVAFKAWKEILILVALAIAVYLMIKNNKLSILRRPLVMLMVGYGLLHLIYAIFSNLSTDIVVAGLMIDLRYIAFFLVVYLATELYPVLRGIMLRVGLAGALVVFVFALLQVFVLPKDILSSIGYGRDTIAPYLTIDQNNDFIRINSTMRGPNPLGAYAMLALTLFGSWLFSKKPRLPRNMIIFFSTSMLGAIVALWFSYSRSALLAAVVSIGALVVYKARHLISRRNMLLGVLTAAVVGLIVALSLSGSSFVANVVLHENPADSNSINSNDGHAESLNDGIDRLVAQPLGSGVGSTGSASLIGEKPLIVENQYLYISHEVGWFGLALFVVIYIALMSALWKRRQDWLSLGLFFSGIGLAMIGILLPVWADDTVAIIWWGLSGLALVGVEYKQRIKKHGS